MLLWVLVFLAAASAVCTVLAVIPRLVASPPVPNFLLGAVGLGAAGLVTAYVTRDDPLAVGMGIGTLLVVPLVRLSLRGWSWLAAELFAVASLAALAYVAYSAQQTVEQSVSPHLVPLLLAGSVILVAAEIVAMALAISYLFEILDVLGRRSRRGGPPPQAPSQEGPWPLVVLQVPMYNEPVEMVGETLEALDRLDYPNYLVQVVDNNTKDPAVWEPIRRRCRELGPRFQFIHLDPWPGFKAGALNEATRRLPKEVEVIGIVDADYLVQPGFLKQTIPYFQDPTVGFVQTPQHYRDWEDDSYLRGLFHSYRYFFDITMPARAHRDAIIFCGTMGLLRRSVLDEIGGWDEECITEDAEASLRILGRGYRGVYHQVNWGEGMMPLTFDGLKKQRFRWALGGIQILRRHWRDLIPLAPHRLRLTKAQRWHYLVGAVQWFGDLLLLGFTLLLIATAIATAAHQRLPVRQITGAVLVIPLLFLLFGVLRAVWAMRRSGQLSWGDSVRALRVWFALSWTVALADIKGLLVSRASFLRTPKRRGDLSGWRQALRSARPETTLAVVAVLAGVVMEVRAFSFTTSILLVLLFFQGAVYLSAPWASLATEGIQITPLRRMYLRSSQNSGGYPVEGRSRTAMLPVAIALAATLGMIVAFAATSPSNQAPFGAGSPAPPSPTPAAPNLVAQATPGPTPSPSPRAHRSPKASPSPGATPSPSPKGSPSAKPSPSPKASPSPTPSPTTSPSPTPTATP